mmetsp:Transcript_90037/g.239231  ORF Transcript_90037/g.239231 Transcript_90037/m.239231 type:complete len:216 (-) Transcript_90037:40-687(-)
MSSRVASGGAPALALVNSAATSFAAARTFSLMRGASARSVSWVASDHIVWSHVPIGTGRLVTSLSRIILLWRLRSRAKLTRVPTSTAWSSTASVMPTTPPSTSVKSWSVCISTLHVLLQAPWSGGGSSGPSVSQGPPSMTSERPPQPLDWALISGWRSSTSRPTRASRVAGMSTFAWCAWWKPSPIIQRSTSACPLFVVSKKLSTSFSWPVTQLK